MSRDTEVAQLAARRHGVITRRQALAAGMSSGAIDNRLVSGRWVRRAGGVYTISGSVETFEQRVTVACAASSGAVASHLTACRLHGLLYLPNWERIDISAPRGTSTRSGVAVVHTPLELDDIDLTSAGGLAVTTIERSLFDAGSLVRGPRLARIVDAALDRRQTSWEALMACHGRLARCGRPGVAAMRAVLEARGKGTVVSESVLERRYLAFCATRRLAPSGTQVVLRWRDRLVGRVDVTYQAERVVVELDGRLGHSQLSDFEHDRIRDQEAAAAGWVVVRVTWDQLTRGHDALERRLLAILEERRTA